MYGTLLYRVRRRIARIASEPGFDAFFNVPMRFREGRLAAVNERLLEHAFCLGEMGSADQTLSVLDFGCARSWLPLSLAALGHQVLGVDLRPFPFHAPRFHFRQSNILDLEETATFDVVISLSTLEHVGLAAYDAEVKNDDVETVLSKISRLIRPGGRFVLTLPVGIPSVDSFERSFAPGEIKELVRGTGLRLGRERYFARGRSIEWSPVTEQEISAVANDVDARSRAGSGVNGVGCFVFSRPTS